MNSKRTYLSGPITGRPMLNIESFTSLRDSLMQMGEGAGNVVVPHELFDADDTDQTWDYYMRRCIAELINCDLVLTLPDWEDSRGAKLEVHIARALSIEVKDANVYLTELKKRTYEKSSTTISTEQIVASTNA